MIGVQAKGEGGRSVQRSEQIPHLIFVGSCTPEWTGCKVWEEEVAMVLGGADMREDGVAGQVRGGSQVCHLGRTMSEKTSCNASRDAEEASGNRSVVFRGERTEGKCAGGQGK